MPKTHIVIAALLIPTLLLYSCCVIQVPPQPAPSASPPPSVQQIPPPQDTTPPTINVISSIKESPDGNEITLKWMGNDDITPANQLFFSYYLEGYDSDYSPPTTETSKTYRNVAVGSYTFHIEARDAAGNHSLASTTLQITVAIAPPKEKEVPPPVTSSFLLLPNSEVNRIAVSSYGTTIYALDSPHARLYKTGSAGFGWTNISGGIFGTPTWDAMAIAPDDHDILAVVTNAGTEVYLSLNGGTEFFITQLAGRLGAGERIKCIAISPGYGNNIHEIAVGTATNAGNGKVWLSKLSRFPGAWQDCSTGAQGWLHGTAGVDIFAIKYSPNFFADGMVVAIAASGPTAATGDTLLYIGARDLSTNTVIWNSIPGYPVELCQQGQDTPGTPLTYADLALPADYSGGVASQRHIYACWTDNPPGITAAGNANDDVYRLDDTVCLRLQARPDTICSLAHYGAFSHGKLLAGALRSQPEPSFSGVQVYCSVNPMSAYPTWQRSQKAPTGTHSAQVAWSPDGKVAYCGTSTTGGAAHDQSAFSRSTNNGLTWNQIGLIDN